MNHDLLQQITELSHEFGTAEFVIGGGGNTSAKTADTLWVKPSGTTLSSLTPQTFVAMDRQKLAKLYSVSIPGDSAAREALVKDMMAAAVIVEQPSRLSATPSNDDRRDARPTPLGRPSVEAPLHDILTGTFVVHTHATLVNGLTCAREGGKACARLFPDALWVPYVDPGFILCMEVRRRYRGESLVILENHGIFVAGNTPDNIRATYRHVLTTLRAEYAKAGIPVELQAKDYPAVPEPVTPDHIVYGKNPKLAPAMARDCALIRQLAAAFGGMQLLDERAQRFIREWEVEAYRQKQMEAK